MACDAAVFRISSKPVRVHEIESLSTQRFFVLLSPAFCEQLLNLASGLICLSSEVAGDRTALKEACKEWLDQRAKHDLGATRAVISHSFRNVH